ncbi:hypothetical protein R3X27_16470 [Tropicimonas sp. TH_r6]|uniref:hypothetical protein n=1 Tax=Tropicimonas sp. TH_r6 TaxID=3082085 RepID=UPI002955749A|nr:hypothetical protein [Tropicimonas sp. TH_r6]MDV7144281.1 hypothetical protein [Tropicimonas sp. TH_r6]
MTLRSRIDRLEQGRDTGPVVVIADCVGRDGELFSHQTDLTGKREILLEPDVDRL